ncbi:MAG: hypothetical protein OEN23_12780 [Paracoccaceae bacterium]|nr:hypothetical protein [Paracoccaceae bacterium]
MSRRTSRRLAGMAAASAAALILAAAAVTPGAGHATQSEGQQVEIEDFTYAPSVAAVRFGDMVTWTNLDIVPHTVTAADGSWDSGEIGPGESWSLIVTESVAGNYFCIYHPGMRARLERKPQD